MKKSILAAIMGCSLLAAGAPAFAEHDYDEHYPDRAGLINLDEEIVVEGTVDRVDTGQIFLRTSDGTILELPSMVMMWNSDPRVTFSSLNSGDALRLVLPTHHTFRLISRANGMTTLGTYDGVFIVPDSTAVAWNSGHDVLIVAEDRDNDGVADDFDADIDVDDRFDDDDDNDGIRNGLEDHDLDGVMNEDDPDFSF